MVFCANKPVRDWLRCGEVGGCCFWWRLLQQSQWLLNWNLHAFSVIQKAKTLIISWRYYVNIMLFRPIAVWCLDQVIPGFSFPTRWMTELSNAEFYSLASSVFDVLFIAGCLFIKPCVWVQVCNYQLSPIPLGSTGGGRGREDATEICN